ncbi:hypothetical protein K432DRAFT_432699 [Lepidopterella palustris CBS 459.81]|uniref:Mid2 domain-containing protein n=1 Tax=Lepidopterella palustris CBS 459.81 TaxID=1314670 RepID=A0A8E2EHK2_9PEZI|nr:hypothetical protein K432DRAFT_432699 [Lepidopterella palustris CBS 459.81]
MRYLLRLVGGVALIPFVNCVAFAGPKPTELVAHRVLNGWSPKPTQGPTVPELRRRQFDSVDTCGWVNGDFSSQIGCPIDATCMLYTDAVPGMAGCCTAPDYQDCGWVNSCVDYSSYHSGSCGSACMRNTFVKKCTDPISQYCVSWTYLNGNVQDYGCGLDGASTWETVLQDITDAYDYITTSLYLPTVADNLVTGWETTATTGVPSRASARASATSSAISSATESTTSDAKATGIAVGVIAGIAVGVFIIFGAIAGLIIFCCMKRKQKKRKVANDAALAAAAASRPQSQYYAPQNPGPPPPPPPVPGQQQQPPKQGYEYFSQPTQPYNSETKYNPQAQPYAVGSPISNPPTPAPAYQNPYPTPYTQVPLPTASPGPEQMGVRPSAQGAVEVPAISVPQPQNRLGPVYEMGEGK